MYRLIALTAALFLSGGITAAKPVKVPHSADRRPMLRRPPHSHRATSRLAARPHRPAPPKQARVAPNARPHTVPMFPVPPPLGPTAREPQVPPASLPFVLPRLPVSPPSLGINAPPSAYGGGGGTVGPLTGGSFGGPPLPGGSFGGGQRTGGSFGDGQH